MAFVCSCWWYFEQVFTVYQKYLHVDMFTCYTLQCCLCEFIFPDEPEIVVQLCPSPITEGDNVSLFCNATGNPAPYVTWIRQSTGAKLSTTEELVLPAITRFEAGQYRCIASNGIRNNSTRRCSLDVLCKLG